MTDCGFDLRKGRGFLILRNHIALTDGKTLALRMGRIRRFGCRHILRLWHKQSIGLDITDNRAWKNIYLLSGQYGTGELEATSSLFKFFH